MISLIIYTVLIIFVKSSVTQTEELTAYNYHLTIGIPTAAEIMAAEAEELAFPVGYRIVGRTTDIKDVPYQAGLVIKVRDLFTSTCGGSLISNTRVVTAAHCNHDGRTKAQAITVVLGSNHLFSGGQRIEAKGIFSHNDWDPNTLINDIAMVSIPDVKYTDVIQPIYIPSPHHEQPTFEGWRAIASGYGLTKSDLLNGTKSTTPRLNSAQLPVISNDECKAEYEDYVTPMKICTSGTGGVGTCKGDSGGPLAIDSDGRKVLIGLISFGYLHGCDKGYPAVYTRISSYAAWIIGN